MAVLIPVGAFCCLVGIRLTFQLHTEYGSLLSPQSWIVLSIIFLLLACWIAFKTLAAGDYVEVRGTLAAGLASVLSFGIAAHLRARQRRQQEYMQNTTDAP